MPKPWAGDPNAIVYSASAFSDIKRCPARRFFARLAREGKIEEDPAIPAVRGSAIHKAIEDRLKFGSNPYVTADLYLQEHLLDKFDASAFNAKEVIENQKVTKRCLDNFENVYLPLIADQITDPEHQVELGLEIPWRKGWLVGKVDLALPHIWADWKTSDSQPKEGQIDGELQDKIYYYMGAKTGVSLPEIFRYVYLFGFNNARKIEIIQRGPNRGKERVVTDDENPKWQFEYDAKPPTPQGVNDSLINQVIPLARIIEENIVYKNPSPQNCSKCKFRTVCPDYKLPTQDEYGILLDVPATGIIRTESLP